MRNILYVSPPARLGGGEISLLTLVEHLPRDKYCPMVATYGDGELVDRMREMGVQVAALRGGRGAGLVLRLAALIRRWEISLVHVNMFDIRAGLAARWTCLPLIGHLRVIFPFGPTDRLFVRLCHRVVSVSDAVRDHFCDQAPDLRDRFITVFNPVDLSVNPGKRPDLRAELGLPEDAPLVGAVGRIDPWKGLDVFVRAAGLIRDNMPEARFIIAGRAGDTPEERAYEQDIRRLVVDLGLESRLSFLGFRPEGLEVVRQLDLLIVPSLILRTPGGIKSEGFGRVAAEALAVGTPVVATRAGGIPEVLGDGEAGVMVPPDNAEAIAASALRLLRDRERREGLIRRGIQRYEALFTPEGHVQRLITIYEAAMKEP